MRRKLARAFTLSTLAALGALALAGQAPAADMSPSGALSRALHAYLERRSSYEFTEDPAALAATIELEREVQSVGPAMLEGEALVQRTILEERLEQAIARGLLRCEGRPSRLRPGPPPREGSAEEAALARRVERLAGTVSDLLPPEIAAATSDLSSERERFPRGPVRASLEALDRALAARQNQLSQIAPPTTASRNHLRLLRSLSGWRGSLDELVQLAEEESRKAGEAMERIALVAGSPSAVALVERLKEEGAHEDPLSVAREEAARAARFAREHGLVTIPEGVFENLRVDDGDPRSRTPFGHYIPLGWQNAHGHYVVTSMRGDDAGALSRRRESYRLWIRGVSAHEGVPGHHLHFSCAARSNDALLRLPYEGPTTEGWGLFVEGFLARAGYFDEPVEARLTPVRMRRWRAVRVILDVGLQTGALSREQAIARLQRDVAFDRTVAEDEVDRYRERPGYYAGYLLGARGFEELERRALARGGPDAARTMRDRILALGPAAPLAAVLRLAADERVPPVR